MKMYVEEAPSGVTVTSNVPFVEPRWWDSPRRHLIWSYTSWVTMIFQSYGYSKPRRWFNKRWSR